MDHSVILQYLQALGFPICASGALGWALWKIGGRLLDSHLEFMNVIKTQGAETVSELKKQSTILDKWGSDPTRLCRAEIVSEAMREMGFECKAGEVQGIIDKVQAQMKKRANHE